MSSIPDVSILQGKVYGHTSTFQINHIGKGDLQGALPHQLLSLHLLTADYGEHAISNNEHCRL